MAESRRLVNPFCFGLGCLFLNAFHNRNGWIYFIGAALSPVLTASFLAMFAFNPYHTPAAKFSGMTNLDERDAVAQRLVVLMNSAGARRLLLRTSAALSTLLLVAMLAIAFLQSGQLNWTLSGQTAQWFPLLILSSSFVMLPIYVNSLLFWSLHNWEGASIGGR
jgi:hypothetical protein